MYDANDAMASPNGNNGARELLVRLYREIGISAVAAALEVTRLPDPTDEQTSKQVHELPGILRGNELAA